MFACLNWFYVEAKSLGSFLPLMAIFLVQIIGAILSWVICYTHELLISNYFRSMPLPLQFYVFPKKVLKVNYCM